MVIKIDGTLPTVDQLRAGLQAGGEVVIYSLPDGATSLDFLEPVIGSVSHLSLFDRRCRDISTLEGAHGLRTIDMDGVRPRRGGDFSSLPLLEASVASCAAVTSILRVPTLQFLYLQGPKPEDLQALPPYLSRLQLQRSRGEVVLPDGDYVDHLTQLTVYSVERLDTCRLVGAPRLAMVEINSVRRWDGAAQLATARSLGRLYLRNVLDIDDPGSLRQVAAREANVEGKHVFSPALRDELSSVRPGAWTFPPVASRYIGPTEATG